jgi:hypothetical protein
MRKTNPVQPKFAWRSVMLTMLLFVLVLLLLSGCSRSTGPEVRGTQEADPIADLLVGPASAEDSSAGGEELRRMGYAVQVGAFAVLENAVGLEASLARQGD